MVCSRSGRFLDRPPLLVNGRSAPAREEDVRRRNRDYVFPDPFVANTLLAYLEGGGIFATVKLYLGVHTCSKRHFKGGESP